MVCRASNALEGLGLEEGIGWLVERIKAKDQPTTATARSPSQQQINQQQQIAMHQQMLAQQQVMAQQQMVLQQQTLMQLQTEDSEERQ